MLRALVYLLLGFFSGGILYARLFPKLLRGVDITERAKDGNPGSANAFKYAGVPVGILTLIAELSKGFWPVAIFLRAYSPLSPLLAPMLLMPVLGHAYSPFHRFKGGKAIAPAFGCLIALLPYSYAVFALAFWYVLFSLAFVVNPHEKRSVVTFIAFMFTCFVGAYFTRHYAMAVGCALLSIPPVVKNLADIRRAEAEYLLAHKEA